MRCRSPSSRTSAAYNRRVRLQLFTSVVGGGHATVARALADALADLGRDDLHVWVDEIYLDHARFPASQFPRLYALTTRRLPYLWRLFFRLTNRPPGPGRLHTLGDWIVGPEVGRLLASRQPDVVVSVLPGINGYLARSLARRALAATVEVVVTDWADIHLGWVSRGVSHYTVPTEAAADQVVGAGVPVSSISVVGLPVRRQFADVQPGPRARVAARERHGLPSDRFVILAMVGSEGTAGAFAHLRALAEAPLDAELVVVCGRNERLRRRVSALEAAIPIRALGYVDEIADLMVAADLLATKAGGLTLAEAFCCRLPVLTFDPLPGQEEGNARYLLSRGTVELARSPRHLAELATELRWSPARRADLASRGSALARPRAADEVAADIVARTTAVSG